MDPYGGVEGGGVEGGLFDPYGGGFDPCDYLDGGLDGLYGGGGEQEGGAAPEGRAAGGGGGQEEELLALRQRLADYEAEVHALRAQVRAQRQLLELLQADALEAVGASSRGAASAVQHEVPLLLAADRGDEDMVRLLMDEGEASSADARKHGDAALLIAAQGGHVGVARALLERGAANVHVDIDSPLLWAAKRGDLPMTELLLEHGADPGALRACALRLAIAGGHADVVRALAAQRQALAGRGKAAPQAPAGP